MSGVLETIATDLYPCQQPEKVPQMKARFIWRALKTRYRDGVAELLAIKRAVHPDDTVCDIGANKGGYTYWLSRWVPKGHVVAFEPQVRLASYLSGVCAAMGLKNVTVEAKAVGDKSGILAMYIPGNSESPGASLSRKVAARETCRSVPVPVVSLDEYFTSDIRIGVLKIDVEGTEMAVFEGAKRILTQQSPPLVFECENRHLESGTVFDVFRYLNNLGYNGEFVCKKRLYPVSEFNPAIH
ncbi:MAG: FkbM family methyltransferase, partial [Verrucomicrobiia bacterium]